MTANQYPVTQKEEKWDVIHLILIANVRYIIPELLDKTRTQFGKILHSTEVIMTKNYRTAELTAEEEWEEESATCGR